MQLSILQNPVQLIGPAVLISVVGYLVHFFFFFISDQKPFADNRSWEIELSGINFFINLVMFPGAIGFALAYYFGNFGAGSLIHFFLASVTGGWLLWLGALNAEKIYDTKIAGLRKLILPWADDKDFETIKKDTAKVGRYIPLWLFSILFIYILTLEYTAGNIIWLTIMLAVIFFNFLLLAFNYSLTLVKLPKVDIHFINSREPLIGSTLLKINDDNIRLRDGDKVIILNKSQVLKVIFDIEQK